jgi:hypothetical protein
LPAFNRPAQSSSARAKRISSASRPCSFARRVANLLARGQRGGLRALRIDRAQSVEIARELVERAPSVRAAWARPPHVRVPTAAARRFHSSRRAAVPLRIACSSNQSIASRRRPRPAASRAGLLEDREPMHAARVRQRGIELAHLAVVEVRVAGETEPRRRRACLSGPSSGGRPPPAPM